MAKKIMLAGGAGYIGSMLTPALLEHGYTVEVIDLCWFGCNLPPEVKVTRKNLFDCRENDFEGFDQIIFLAGLSNDPMAEYSPSNNFIYNAALPSYLAYIAKRVGVKRYIYASSCSVYGYTINQLYDEESPATCGYPYGISKLQGERGVTQLADNKFSVISLRQGTVCGHSPRMRFDLIVNTMFKTAITEGRIVVNNPAIWRPIYDLRDAVNAYLRSIQSDYTVNGVFNVTSGNYTVGQVADLVKREIEKLTGKRIIIELKNIEDFRNYKVTWEKAKTELGFQPKMDIPDIVADLYDHLQQYGDFSDDRYYNIKTFKTISL
jgi:nucleoside-diphosphate-sugar epimerase